MAVWLAAALHHGDGCAARSLRCRGWPDLRCTNSGSGAASSGARWDDVTVSRCHAGTLARRAAAGSSRPVRRETRGFCSKTRPTAFRRKGSVVSRAVTRRGSGLLRTVALACYAACHRPGARRVTVLSRAVSRRNVLQLCPRMHASRAPVVQFGAETVTAPVTPTSSPEFAEWTKIIDAFRETFCGGFRDKVSGGNRANNARD